MTKRSAAGLVLLGAMGCATTGWFRPVAGADNATPVFCAVENPQATTMVVAARVSESVESAAITVKALEAGGPLAAEESGRRGGVNLLPHQTTCVRVPLLAPVGEFRRYTVSIDGYRAGRHVEGGAITCVPKVIRNWPCTIE